MRIRLFWLLLMAGQCLPTFLMGQTLHRKELQLFSKHLDAVRQIWVSEPLHHEQVDHPYHVLYLLDGDVYQNQKLAIALRDHLFEAGGYIYPLLIVGVEQVERGSELKPFSETGGTFLSFLTEEVIPYIDQRYQTTPHRFIGGHSLGGHFALYAWMKRSEFHSCLAFSPAIYNTQNRISKELDQFLAATDRSGYLYLNHGTEGTSEQKILEHIDELTAVLQRNPKQEAIRVDYRRYDRIGHNFTLDLGLVEGLLLHYQHWSVPSPTFDHLWEGTIDPVVTLRQFHQDLSAWVGFPTSPKSDLLGNLSNAYRQMGKMDLAWQLNDWALEIDPNNAFAWYYRSFLLESSDQLGESLEAAQNALRFFDYTDVVESTPNYQDYEVLHELLRDRLHQLKEK
jgi:predicted alpha/beta superfamily hydrolase